MGRDKGEKGMHREVLHRDGFQVPTTDVRQIRFLMHLLRCSGSRSSMDGSCSVAADPLCDEQLCFGLPWQCTIQQHLDKKRLPNVPAGGSLVWLA